MARTKTSLVICSIVEKIQLVCGIFLLFLFGLMTIMCLSDKELGANGVLEFSIVVTAIGILLIFLSRRRNRLIQTFKRYVPSLASNPTGSISILAASMGTSEDVVLKNLDQMIRKKLFTYAYIDRHQNRLIFRNREQNPAGAAAVGAGAVGAGAAGAGTIGGGIRSTAGSTTTSSYSSTVTTITVNGVPVTASPTTASSAPPELMTVTCKGCGGVNTVEKGQVTECEYCGSKIKGAAS